MSNVLILGKDDDVIVSKFQTLCNEADHQITLLSDPVTDDVHIEGPFDVIMHCDSFGAPTDLDWLLDTLDEGGHALVAEHSVIFISTVCHSASAVTRDYVYTVKPPMIAYSGLALLQDHDVLEVAKPALTQEDTLLQAKMFLSTINIKPIDVPMVPGLILPRILAMLINEAASALMEGVASPEDIDTAMAFGTNYPDGPLAWADKIGVDRVLEILEHLYDEYKEERYRPMLLLKQMVHAGELGLKTGQGFYSYDTAVPVP